MPYCTNCGKQVDDDAFFCARCGTRTRHGAEAHVSIPFPSDEMSAAFHKMADEMEKTFSKVADEVQKSEVTEEAKESFYRVGKEFRKTLSNAAEEAKKQKVGERVEKAFSTAADRVDEAFRAARETVVTRIPQGPVYCQKCGKKNESYAKFCYDCGKKLE